MPAQFGMWPPAPADCRLIGRYVLDDDGTILFTSRNPDGTPFVASVVFTPASGIYQAVLSKRLTSPTVAPSLIFSGVAGGQISASGAVGAITTHTCDDAGAPTDRVHSVEVYDI